MKLNQREIIPPLMMLRKTNTPSLETKVDNTSLPVFDKFFIEYWSSIYRLLSRMLGDPSEAEDLTLEAFYRLFKKHPNPEPEFNVGGWLYRVATNLGLQSIRSFKRREHYEMNAGKVVFMTGPEDDPMEALVKKEEDQMARWALAMMKPRQSELLVLRYSGKTYREIAQALNLSPASIGPLLLREREFEKCYRSLKQEDQ